MKEENPPAPVRQLSVIIPFYQRTPGLLAGAVRSVAAQRLPWPLRVELIVVDDASPLPAEAELASVELPDWIDLRILRQDNAGPGAARNCGLDAMRPESRFVAFLDSDDRWTPDHLRMGIEALECGHDFYFCDSDMPPDTLFGGLALFEQARHLPAFDPVEGCPDLLRFRPDRLGWHMVEEYLCQTSAVILRADAVGALRFEERLRYAGEDWLMWVRIAHGGGGVCFSRAVNSLRGEGINLYRDAHERLDSPNVRRLLAMILANRLMGRTPGLSDEARALTRRRMAMFRQEIAAILMHPALYRRLRSGQAWRIVGRAYAALGLRTPGLWMQIIARKFRPRRTAYQEQAA